MKIRMKLAAWAAASCLAALAAATANANQIPGAVITGHLISVAGTEWINVDGHNYRIASSSAAASVAAKLTPGQLVDVQLNGPVNSAASEVINVVAHSGQ